MEDTLVVKIIVSDFDLDLVSIGLFNFLDIQVGLEIGWFGFGGVHAQVEGG